MQHIQVLREREGITYEVYFLKCAMFFTLLSLFLRFRHCSHLVILTNLKIFYPLFGLIHWDIMISYYHCECSIHPPPAFGSSLNLEELALQACESEIEDADIGADANTKLRRYALYRCDLFGF